MAMERDVKIDDVRTFETRNGNTRYVVRDSEDNEYTTFREAIGDKARALEGKRAHIGFHEQQRGEYRLYEKLKAFKDRVAEDIKND